MNRVHHLKCWPEWFAALQDGAQTAEVRLDDRGFEVGDRLVLREWEPPDDPHRAEWAGYTGKEAKRTISHILRGHPRLTPGYVMLSFDDVFTCTRPHVKEK